MKKLIFLLLLPFLLAACSKDDNGSDVIEPEQKPTSFTFVTHEDVSFPNCVIGYYKGGLCIKLAELGELSKDKVSKEVIVEDGSITDIYFFTDYMKYDEIINGEIYWIVIKLDATYTLKKNTLNSFVIQSDTKGVRVRKDDPVQYPH